MDFPARSKPIDEQDAITVWLWIAWRGLNPYASETSKRPPVCNLMFG